MATLRYYRNLYFAGNANLSTKDVCRWLTNDHATETGPGMKIVCAYDASQGAGSRKILPTVGDETNWENAAFAAVSGFAWTSTNALAANDWVVLQSTLASNPWQIVILVSSTTSVVFVLLPYGDFNTAQAEASPPTLPTKTVYLSGTTWLSFNTRNANHYACAISDGEFFAFVTHNGTSAIDLMYCGIIDNQRVSDSSRPYVAFGTATPYWGAKSMKRLSPIDDTLIDGSADIPNAHSSAASAGDGVLSQWLPAPVSISWTTAGHRHFGGYFRNLYCVHYGIGYLGTLTIAGSDHQYAFFGAAGGYAATVFKWDGATPLPTA